MRRIMNIAPARGSRIVLAAIPFVLILLIYIMGSAERRAANPDDKLLPPISEMAQTTKRLAGGPDRPTGRYAFWDRHRGQHATFVAGIGNFNPDRAGVRADGRAAADHGGFVRYHRRRDLDDSAD